MLDPFLLSLGLKLVVAALVVIVAALLAERSGPFLGAMIVTLPISTGPSYVFLAMEHSPEFLSTSALSGLVANAGTPIFMSAYAMTAQRFGVVVSIGVAAFAWASFAAASLLIDWSLPLAVLANICLYGVGAELLNRVPPAPIKFTTARQWWDLPMRAVGVMTLCALVIFTAHKIGPKAAGLVALAPMGFTSLALVMHPRAGGSATAAVFASALPGMVGFAAALLVVHVAVVPLGAWLGLACGLGLSLLWNGSLLVARKVMR